MFNFDNIKKLFKYDWNNIIDETAPKGNKSLIDESSYKDIQFGAIINIAASCVLAIATIIMTLIVTYINLLGGTDLFASKFNFTFSIFGGCMIPIAIIIYNSMMKDKEQNSYPHFIAAIVLLLQCVYHICAFIPCLFSFFFNPFLGIITIIGNLVIIFGNINIAVGCIDFSKKCHKEYIDSKEKDSKKKNKVKTSPIKENEVSMHKETKKGKTPKVNFCSNCGMQLKDESKFCGNCGTKIG